MRLVKSLVGFTSLLDDSAFMFRVGFWESNNYPSLLSPLKGVVMGVTSPSGHPVLISENRNSSWVLQAPFQRHFVSYL